VRRPGEEGPVRCILGLSVVVSIAAGVMVAVGAGTASADPSANAWYQLRQCESSNRYDINTGNGYYGAYQFDLATWRSVGGTGYPNQASPAEQDYRALILYRERGWSPWTCAFLIGLKEDKDARSGIIPPKPSGVPSGSGSTTPPPTTSTKVPAWPGVQYFQGDSSDQLKVWQKQMGKMGYGLTGTGFFGPKTFAAVNALQKKAGLNVVGFIGPKTWAAAWNPKYAKNATTGSNPTITFTPQTNATCHVGAATAPAFPGVLTFGETSRAIQCFQKQLAHRGYNLSGTGYFGPITKGDVIDLQQRNLLSQTGAVDARTWKAAWQGKAKE
jgi:peptidoglycan hydrolase-like protein with peptidoglycan-binding domain